MKQIAILIITASILASCKTTKKSEVNQSNSLTLNHSIMNLKDHATKFLTAVATYDDKAVATFLPENHVQHNPNLKDGKEPFVDFMSVLKEYQVKLSPVRLFQDGNYIITQAIADNAQPFGAEKMVIFDIWKFDNAGKLVEHWDCMQANTPPNPSGRTLTDGSTEVVDIEKTGENKKIIGEFITKATQATKPEDLGLLINTYFNPEFKQHNPGAGDGINGMFEGFQNGGLGFSFTKLHQVFGEGNFILTVSEGTNFGTPSAFYDLFRLEDGKIVEHWDIIQDIPENSANANTMFNFPQQ